MDPAGAVIYTIYSCSLMGRIDIRFNNSILKIFAWDCGPQDLGLTFSLSKKIKDICLDFIQSFLTVEVKPTAGDASMSARLKDKDVLTVCI